MAQAGSYHGTIVADATEVQTDGVGSNRLAAIINLVCVFALPTNHYNANVFVECECQLQPKHQTLRPFYVVKPSSKIIHWPLAAVR